MDKKTISESWKFSHKGTKYADENIFIISGDQLYKIITGKDDSLFQLYKKLPQAIDDFLATVSQGQSNTNSALSEFKKDIEQSERSLIDEITFSNYNYYLGFDKL